MPNSSPEALLEAGQLAKSCCFTGLFY